MNEYSKSLFYIHLAVFLFGFVGLFARFVNQPAIIITFGRSFFSSIFLFVLIKCSGTNAKLNSRNDYILIFVSGLILAIHWYCFMESIQLSTVAIGTITFSAFPIFTSILEPILFREKISLRSVICSIIMIVGVCIISSVPAGGEFGGRVSGVILGMVSSLSYAVLSLLNRNFSSKYKPEIIVFYEQATAMVLIMPFFFILRPAIAVKDVVLLIILGTLLTAFSHMMYVKSLRNLKVTTAGIITGLEAVYSIILAVFLLKEKPSFNEIIGGLIVIGIAAYITLFKGKPGHG